MNTDAPSIRAVRADKERRLIVAWKGRAESVVDEAGSHLLPKTVRLAAIGLDAQAEAA